MLINSLVFSEEQQPLLRTVSELKKSLCIILKKIEHLKKKYSRKHIHIRKFTHLNAKPKASAKPLPKGSFTVIQADVYCILYKGFKTEAKVSTLARSGDKSLTPVFPASNLQTGNNSNG